MTARLESAVRDAIATCRLGRDPVWSVALALECAARETDGGES